MNSSQTRQQINELLQEIGKLVNHSSDSSLERELLKQKCILLYDAINKLQDKETVISPPPVVKETPVAVPQKVQEIKPLIEEQVNKKEEEEVIPEPVPVVIPVAVEPIRQPEPVVETKRQNEEIDRIIEERKKQTEQNLFQQHLVQHKKEELHIHEKLSSSGINRDIKDRFNQKVESLKSAISLNKKIAFVNILFKENTVEYAKAIERLNSASTLDEAMRYFNELKHQYAWENNHDMVKELEQLLTKRFN